MNKILSNQSWEGVAEMKADVLQEMIMNRYVEAISQVAKKKVRKTGKKKTPVHLRKYIRMKRKAGKQLKKKKNLSPEKNKRNIEEDKTLRFGDPKCSQTKAGKGGKMPI